MVAKDRSLVVWLAVFCLAVVSPIARAEYIADNGAGHDKISFDPSLSKGNQVFGSKESKQNQTITAKLSTFTNSLYSAGNILETVIHNSASTWLKGNENFAKNNNSFNGDDLWSNKTWSEDIKDGNENNCRTVPERDSIALFGMGAVGIIGSWIIRRSHLGLKSHL